MSKLKEEVCELLKKLPDDCNLEDFQYHLFVLEKVRRGLARIEMEATLSQQQDEQRLARWLSKSPGPRRRSRTSGRSPIGSVESAGKEAAGFLMRRRPDRRAPPPSTIFYSDVAPP